jgi:hypothetical protein
MASRLGARLASLVEKSTRMPGFLGLKRHAGLNEAGDSLN